MRYIPPCSSLTSALVICTPKTKPWLSTNTWRLRPLTFLCPSQPRRPLFQSFSRFDYPPHLRLDTDHVRGFPGIDSANDHALVAKCLLDTNDGSNHKHFPTAGNRAVTCASYCLYAVCTKSR